MTDFNASDRDVNRAIRSWLHEDRHEDVSRIAGAVLDQVETTRQRRSWWPARRFEFMNTYAKFALAAAAVLVVAVVGYNFLPGRGGVGGPAATPSPSPAPIAVGSFSSHGGNIELEATGDGADVTGTMTYTDTGGADLGRFAVDLACTRTTDSGLIVIGGLVTDSSSVDEVAPEGSNVAIILQRGSPVKAVFWLEHPDPHEASCPAFRRADGHPHEEGDPRLRNRPGELRSRPRRDQFELDRSGRPTQLGTGGAELARAWDCRRLRSNLTARRGHAWSVS